MRPPPGLGGGETPPGLANTPPGLVAEDANNANYNDHNKDEGREDMERAFALSELRSQLLKTQISQSPMAAHEQVGVIGDWEIWVFRSC